MSASKEDIEFKGEIIVYVDIETTGLDTSTADTIELAAIVEPRCKHEAEIGDTFSSLIYPENGSIPAAASKVNGIYMKDVEHQPKFKDVATKFFEWLTKWKERGQKIILVAHNNFGYDAVIIKRQCKQLEVAIPSFVAFGDSLLVFRWCFPFPQRRFALQQLANIWLPPGTETIQDHRALSDVKLLILVIQHCPSTQSFFRRLLTQSYSES